MPPRHVSVTGKDLTRVTIRFQGRPVGYDGLPYTMLERRTIEAHRGFTYGDAVQLAIQALGRPEPETNSPAYENVMYVQIAFN